ncbi:MAG: hypothetical protein KGJ02_08350 [Verrucomicrobiota bacterium]|nr:hypothetical protein [Verrucomicrobiota bacterium]
MLDFFRKYQRAFFFVITVMVIASFSFFGTFSTFTNVETRPDRVIGKAIDGSDLRLLEIEALARFLSTDREDIPYLSHQIPLNLLNDGVIRRDFLSSGIADVLVRGSFSTLKESLAQKFQRMKTFKAYEHPHAPFLSAKAVWERFVPALNREWSAIQTMEELNPEAFGHVARLYQLQSTFPSEWLRQVLAVQERQYKWLQPDERLRQDDLSIFGFHSMADWFGKDFIDLVAEFIHNAAIEAEKKGYVVSLEEAKGDLRRIFSDSMQKVQEAKLPLNISYKEQLRVLGMEESEAAQVWRKVLLLRRYFHDAGQSAFIDRLPYSEFAKIANEKATVDIYGWGKAFHVKNALDALALDTYLKSVSGQSKALPKELLTVEQVQEKTPELIQTLYTAKVSAVDKREAALRAPLKEVWDFEISDEAWKGLKKEFPFLQALSSNTPEERFQFLETLDPVRRAKVDLYARRRLLEKHGEWVKEALNAAQGEEKQLVLSAGRIHLPHLDNPHRLGSLFEQILSCPEIALSELQQFDSGEAVFRFENIAKISDRKIKTLEEAKSDGSIALLVERVLEKEYPKLKSKLPTELQVKEFKDVKEDLAALLMGYQAEALEKNQPLFYAAAKQAQKELQAKGWTPVEGEDPLVAQFKIQRWEKEISRTNEEDWMAEQSFELLPEHWSPIHVDPTEGVSFLYVKERTASDLPILNQLFFGKEMLVADVQRFLAEELFHLMVKKNAIAIPLQIPVEE